MVGGDFVIEIQLAFTGYKAGTSSNATITATNAIFGILPRRSTVFFVGASFLELPFFDGSTIWTCFVSRLRISPTSAARPIEESTITDVAVSNSNLENVEPAYAPDRKSTRLNSSHPSISYAVFCLKKKIF